MRRSATRVIRESLHGTFFSLSLTCTKSVCALITGVSVCCVRESAGEGGQWVTHTHTHTKRVQAAAVKYRNVCPMCTGGGERERERKE